MEMLQGFNGKEIASTPFGKGKQNNVTALANWVSAESKGKKFNLPQAHVQERVMYEAGKRLFFINAAARMIFPAPRVTVKTASAFVCRTYPT